MVVLGDSIAAGYGVARHESAAYIFAQEHGYDLVNFGFPGNDSRFLRHEVNNVNRIKDDIERADVILISIGGNDFLLAGSWGELVGMVFDAALGDLSAAEPILEAFAENFAAIITQVRALNPNATVIVQTMFNPSPPVPSLYRAAGAAMGALNDHIQATLALDPDAFLIACVYTAFTGLSGVAQMDLIHPNARGHRVIAQVLADTYLGTQTEIVPPRPVLDLVLRIFSPVIWLFDLLFIRIGLRIIWPSVSAAVMRSVDILVNRFFF
jgi:lysophospholipase L1-like esterase